MEPTHPAADSREKIDFFLLSAHELRTSLTALKWLFKMLKDGDYGPLTEEQSVAISQACESSEHMVALLNNTMNIIKNDGVITYSTLPVHLATVIAETVKEFSNEAISKHIGLTYHQPPTPIIIAGDEQKLRIAFHNIIENAIKYSKPESEILISLSLQGAQAVLQVQDHGIGIPPAQVDHLFERFYRVGNNKETGTGLGLYSTKLIVERHGGTITMASEEGAGSTVTISLPLHE